MNTLFSGFIHFSCLFFLPQYLQVIMGYNPIRAGIYFIPFLITTVALSWIGVRYHPSGIALDADSDFCFLQSLIVNRIRPWLYKVRLIVFYALRLTDTYRIEYDQLRICHFNHGMWCRPGNYKTSCYCDGRLDVCGRRRRWPSTSLSSYTGYFVFT